MFRKRATRTVTIGWPAGLHARPSLAVAQIVRRFTAEVRVRRGDETVDGSDILQLLSLGADHGEELELSAQGREAHQVLDELERLFANHEVPDTAAFG